MILSDESIKRLIKEGVLSFADIEKVGPISCDITIENIYFEGQRLAQLSLPPTDSAFIETRELLDLGGRNLAAEVRLRNRFLRKGLSLDAPLYFPGHKSRLFFRITNLCSEPVDLRCGDSPAQVVFFEVDKDLVSRYSGRYNGEVNYENNSSLMDIGRYDAFEAKSKQIDEKIHKYEEQIDSINKSIYGNVLALMGIFVAVASIANTIAAADPSCIRNTVVLCMVITGSFSILFGFISLLFGKRKNASSGWSVGMICFAFAVALTLFAGSD